ncbi:MAG: terminase small subunit [Leptospirillum sp.]
MKDKLTPKQEAFVLAYIETGNASEAYRRAYDAGKMLPGTINRKAFELLENGKVTARIAELRAITAEKWGWTRDRAYSILKKVLDSLDSKPSDIIAAVKVLNEMTGLNSPQKHEITGGMILNVHFVRPGEIEPDSGIIGIA